MRGNRYPTILTSEATREAAKEAKNYGISVAHQTAFRTGYIARILERKRSENCYASSSFRSAWLDGWYMAPPPETVHFSTDLAVESQRRT